MSGSFALLLVLSFIAAAASSQDSVNEDGGRFMWSGQFLTTTETVTVKTTTVLPTLITEICLSTSESLAACRRRRGVQEQPEMDVEEFTPTQVLSIENTEMVMTPNAKTVAEVELTGSQEPREEEIKTDEDVVGRNAAAVYLKEKLIKTKYVTTTIISTAYTPVVVTTRTFTIGGCLPAGVEQFSTCSEIDPIVGVIETSVVQVELVLPETESGNEETTAPTA